jgi:hypothetical protein
MATEKFGTLGRNALNGAINNSTTSIVLWDVSTFPTSGQFRVIVDRELMTVTAISGKTFTVTRGVESTTAIAHLTGANVIHVLTTGAYNQSIADNKQSGAYASLPAVEKAGRMYETTNSIFQLRDTGAAWKAYGPIRPLKPLASSDYTWLNQGSATGDFSGGTLALYSSTSSANSNNILYKAAPSTPWTVTIHCQIWPCLTTNFNSCCLSFIETSSGKFSNMQCGQSSTIIGLWVEKWNTATSYNSEYTSGTYPTSIATALKWFQLADNGTTRYYRVSWDGIYFYEVYSVGRTDFLTPNAVGVSIRQDGSDNALKAFRIYSWVET